MAGLCLDLARIQGSDSRKMKDTAGLRKKEVFEFGYDRDKCQKLKIKIFIVQDWMAGYSQVTNRVTVELRTSYRRLQTTTDCYTPSSSEREKERKHKPSQMRSQSFNRLFHQTEFKKIMVILAGPIKKKWMKQVGYMQVTTIAAIRQLYVDIWRDFQKGNNPLHSVMEPKRFYQSLQNDFTKRFNLKRFSQKVFEIWYLMKLVFFFFKFWA